MREFVAYAASALVHASMLGLLSAGLDEPPQLFRVQLGRASIDSVAAHVAQPVGVVEPELALLEEVDITAPREPTASVLEPETLAVARQITQLTLARRDEAPEEEEIAVSPPPPSRPRPPVENEPPPVAVQPPEKRPPQPREIDKPADVIAEASMSSAPSRAQSGAEDDDLPPSIVTNPAPPYPPEARAAGQQGVVVLLVTVSPTGTVAKVSLYGSSGFPVLDQSALAAVPHWRFQPGKRRGVAVQYEVRVPVRFSIRN